MRRGRGRSRSNVVASQVDDPSRVGRRRAGAGLAAAHPRHLRRRRARARRRRRVAGATSTRSRSPGARPGRLAAGRRVVREGGGGGGRPAAGRACIISPATSSRSCSQNGELPLPAVVLVVSGGHTSLYLVEPARRRTSCSAARATMRRARRTTRWRSCSASAIRAGRSSIGWPRSGNDRAIALPTTRLTHADRNAPELKGDLDFSFSGLKTAVLRHVAARRRGRRRAARRAGDRRHLRQLPARRRRRAGRSHCSTRRARHRRAGASASPAACRPTAGCAPTLKARGDAREIPTFVPSLALSTDNAAMIAAAGLRKFRAGDDRADCDLNADAVIGICHRHA